MKKFRNFLGSLIVLLILAVTLPVLADPLQTQDAANAQPDRPALGPLPVILRASAADCIAETDLTIYKYLVGGVGAPGEEIEYRIEVRHGTGGSNAAAQDVVITDTLPADVTYVSDYNEYGFATVSTTGGQVVWTRPVLNPDEYAYIYLRVRIADSPTVQPGDVLTNVVHVTSSDPITNTFDDVFTNTAKVEVDTFISKSGPSEAPQGEEMTYLISFGNNSDLAAADVVITDTLPLSTTFVAWSSDQNVDAPNHELFDRIVTPTVTSADQVVWSLGTVEAWESGSIYAVVQVSDTVPVFDVLTNVVQITTSAAETYLVDNVVTDTTTVYTPTWDVQLVKSLHWSSDDPVAGNDVKYQLYFENTGNAPARDVLITDTLPVSTTFVSWSSSVWGSSHYIFGREITTTVDATQVVWHIGTLRAGQYGYIYPLVHITETVPVGTVLTNTAHITSTNPDYNPANDIDTDGTTVISPTRDMHVEKIVYSTDEAAPGAKFRYRIRVWNQGNATAHDVVLTDTLPISTSYVSWSAYSRSESHYIFGREVVESVSNNQVVWDLGSIEASHSDYIYLTVHVSDTVAVGAVLTNTVEVSTSNMDEDPSDDLVELATTVVPPAWDMAVDYKELSWSSDVPLVGGNEIEYYIEFSNYGNMAARDVIITDDLPANVTFVSWYGEAEDPDVDLDETITWTVSNNQVVWYLGEVAAGQYGYIYPTVQVMNTAMARDVLCNRVQISTSDMDEEPFNDVYTHTVTVYVPTWDVYVSKYLNSLAGAPGGEMEYEIYFGNEGHATARDVVVTDTLPANTTFVDWRGYVHNPYISEWDDTITPEVIGNQVVWHLGEVEAGQYGYIYPTVRIADGVNIGDVLTNVVEISTSDDDWDWTDDSYVLTTTVSPPVVDLDIYKYTACTGAPDGAMEYSISVENYGNVAASDVVITDTFPVSTTFLSWLGYSYDPSLDLDQMITPTVNGNQVVWHIGTVSVGQSIHLQPLVHVSDLVNVGDELVNVARVSTSDVDIETSNNVATETTTIVSPTVDVTISKYAYLAVPGGIMEYWIDFYNGGSITAPDVVITDTLPMSTSFDSWTGSFSSSSTNLHDVISPTVSGDQVIWHLGAVTGCTSGHIYMNVYISDTVQVGDVLTNVIEISTTGDDDNIENNIYTSTAIVEALYALTGVTVTGPVTGLVDTSYTFTATVSPPTATTPIRYEWQTTDGQSSETTKGGSYNKVHFTWAATGTKTIVVTATNAGGPVTATHTITISAPPPCYELTGVEIVGPTAGYEDTSYTFTSVITPSNATEPINYTWTSSPPGTLAMPGQPSAAFTWPATGTKTIQLTAENCEGVTVTDTHTIELAAMEQVSVTVEPGTGVTLVYTDPQGLPTTVEVPAGAVTDTTTIVYTPVPSPTESITTGLRFANHAFDLEAYRNDVLLPDFTFEQPVTVTVHYSDDDVAGLDEDTLTLYYWDGSAWVDAATTCDPDSIYDRHPLDNWFAVSICHLTRWGAYGTEISQYPIFLPIVLKNH